MACNLIMYIFSNFDYIYTSPRDSCTWWFDITYLSHGNYWNLAWRFLYSLHEISPKKLLCYISIKPTQKFELNQISSYSQSYFSFTFLKNWSSS